jgi:hypothetical protein
VLLRRRWQVTELTVNRFARRCAAQLRAGTRARASSVVVVRSCDDADLECRVAGNGRHEYVSLTLCVQCVPVVCLMLLLWRNINGVVLDTTLPISSRNQIKAAPRPRRRDRLRTTTSSTTTTSTIIVCSCEHCVVHAWLLCACLRSLAQCCRRCWVWLAAAAAIAQPLFECERLYARSCARCISRRSQLFVQLLFCARLGDAPQSLRCRQCIIIRVYYNAMIEHSSCESKRMPQKSESEMNDDIFGNSVEFDATNDPLGDM